MWIQNFVQCVQTHSSQPTPKMLAVTGYWNLCEKSRTQDSHSKFLKSFQNTTVFNTDYAVYGEQEVVSSIQQIRRKNSVLQQNCRQTHSQVMSFDMLVQLCENGFGADLMQKISRTSLSDPIHCPSAELVMVWLSKVLLVRKAIESFPDYTHFGWIDAGFKGHIENVSRKWPADSIESIRGLYVSRLGHACKESFWRNQGRTASRCPMGGMWFGDKSSVLEFIEHTIAIVRENLLQGDTVCADQDIFELSLQRMKSDVHDSNYSWYNAIFI